MQPLLQSDFLQALGKAITASFWQMALLFLAYHIFIFSGRIKHAFIKNFISTFFSIAGLVWFASTVILQWKAESQLAASVVIENTQNNSTVLSALTRSNQWQLLQNWAEYKFNFVLPYLSVAYLFVLCWFVLKLSLQIYKINSLQRYGMQTISGEMNAFFAYLVQSTGTTKKVQLFFSTQIDIPATIGFLKPVVLLPFSTVTHLTPAQLEAVLLHELSHIKRNDYFWNLLLASAETILFFNPFALLLISAARRERENSCDDYVMQFQNNAPVYAEALLNVEKARRAAPRLAMALGDDKHQLKNRIKRILNLPSEKNKISSRLAILVFFTLLFASAGWIIKNTTHTAANATAVINLKKETPKTIFIKPETVLEQDNKSVSLFDEKRKMRLEIKKELHSPAIKLWEEDGKEVPVDKLVFKNIPAEWMELMVRPGLRNPLPPETFFLPSDSAEKTFRKKIEVQEKFWHELATQNNLQHLKQQPGFYRERPEMFYEFHFKNRNTDSLFSPFGFFPDFENDSAIFNEDFFYKQKIENDLQVKQRAEQLKQRFAQKKNQNRQFQQSKKIQDSVLSERFKFNFPEDAAYVYFNNRQAEEYVKKINDQFIIITDDIQMHKERIQQVHDSSRTKKPHHIIIKRLEISRL